MSEFVAQKSRKEQKTEDKENAEALKVQQVSAFAFLSMDVKLLNKVEATRLLYDAGCDSAEGFMLLDLESKRAVAACLKPVPKAQLAAAFTFTLTD